GLRALLLLLVIVALALALFARLRDEEWVTLWLVAVGMLVFLAIQFVYVRDHLDGGNFERMNTVFKFGFQSWTLLALAAAAAVPVVLRLLGRLHPLLPSAWTGALLVLVGAGAVYPLVGTSSRVATRFSPHPGPTLDGLDFLATAAYDNDDHHILLHDDRAGIDWLNRHVAGLQVVYSNDREFYRAYGVRIAANTGLPTIYGNGHEGEQRPHTLIDPRVTDSTTLATTGDIPTTIALLRKYGVNYVYVGPLERAFWTPSAVIKWETMASKSVDRVFEQGSVRIYRVRPNLVVPPVASLPPAVAENGELAMREAANTADPTNGSAAFGLATLYLQLKRPEDAARVLQAAAGSNPKDVPLHQLLGDTEAGLGHADAAQTALQQAVDADPSMGNLNKLATVMIKLSRWAVAEQALQRARTVAPSAPDPLFTFGELYRLRNAAGDRERAVAAYQAFLQAAPADAQFRTEAAQHLQELK
nr:tetratricopeptide repeat protein [Herpetosiphonaceae bacterium]